MFLTGNVREAASTVRAKTRPGNHQRAGGEDASLPPQVVFEAILTREKMGSTGIGNGIAIPHGKLEEDTCAPLAFSFSSKRLIAFDAIDNQPVDLLFALLVP
ncbi:PTS sugar transporter subunit IIA [Escherichia coli]